MKRDLRMQVSFFVRTKTTSKAGGFKELFCVVSLKKETRVSEPLFLNNIIN